MSWKQAQLKDLVFFQRGFDITRAEQKSGTVPVISSSGVTSYHDEAKVAGPGIVIGRKGTLGSVHFSAQDFWPHDTTLWSKDLHSNDPKFVYYFLKTLHLEKYNVGNANPTLNRNHIHGLDIRIPPVETQTRISSVLSEYDALIENNRRRIRLLEESARLLYREWFVRFRFPGHEKSRVVDRLPEGWTRKPVCSVAEINALSLSTNFSEHIHYVDIASVSTGSINYTTPYNFADAPGRARRVVRHGDMIWSCVRPNRASYALIWKPIENLIVSTGFCVLSPTKVSSAFLYQALSTADFVGYLAASANGAAYPAVVSSDFASYEMVVPTSELIEHFQRITEPLFDTTLVLDRQATKLADARDLLLPKLMSGEVQV